MLVSNADLERIVECSCIAPYTAHKTVVYVFVHGPYTYTYNYIYSSIRIYNSTTYSVTGIAITTI